MCARRARTAIAAAVAATLAATLVTLAGSAGASHDGSGPHARPSDDSCPPGQVQPAHFFDVADADAHAPAIDCLVWYDVASGRSPLDYLPAGEVTRAQMARFVRNLVERSGGNLPAPSRDHFSDDNGTLHEDSINRVAEAGIVTGRGGDRFTPDGQVERGQLATFLVHAYQYRAGRELPAPSTDAFSDDNGTVHEASTDKAAEAGFVAGTGPGRYTPEGLVRRDQMASFLVRVLDLLVEDGLARTPAPGAGDIDLAFGDRGSAAMPFSQSDDPRDVAIDVLPVADGKTVVVGRTMNAGPTLIALARLAANGTLDRTFGEDGTVTTSVSSREGGSSFPADAAVHPDGTIVVVGFADTDDGVDHRGLLVRYTADGALDPSFGGDGTVSTAPLFASALALQADGRVVVAGTVPGALPGTRDIAVARFLVDGSPDPSFGTGGRAVTDVRGRDDQAEDVVLQRDGRIVVAGGSAEPHPDDPNGLRYSPRATLLRYLPGGRLDTGFGDGGIVRTDTGRGTGDRFYDGFDEFSSVAVASDGSLVAAGSSLGDAPPLRPEARPFDVLLARYDATGTPDPAFDGDGVVLSALAASSLAVDLALDRSDRLVVVARGQLDDGSPYSFLVLGRYAPDGRLDATFGDGGVVRSGIGEGRAVALTDAGIHVAGTDNQPFRSRSGRASRALVSRFLAEEPVSR